MGSNPPQSAAAAYEDRMNTALRKAPPPQSYAAASAASTASNNSSAVQKSKSYSNFDFVRRDLNFQVCITHVVGPKKKKPKQNKLIPHAFLAKQAGCTGVVKNAIHSY